MVNIELNNHEPPAHHGHEHGKYYVMRFFPDPATGEFLNVGIILIDAYNGRIKIAVPMMVTMLRKVQWAEDSSINAFCENCRNFLERLSELSFPCNTGEMRTGKIKPVSRIDLYWNLHVIKHINSYQLHAGGPFQLSECMPCNTKDENLINMLYSCLVDKTQ